ncbi:MAG: hypothetical protein A2Z14_01880 [Chloroflexi bacterium RBG_16_48_8]|nr:MAG: hypothetical protein A2Z14_01880 [Chloroflexi bacterium RBG_16_48_8]
MMDARYWIEALGLERHPEGGYYKQTYRSDEVIHRTGLPERFPGPRFLSTSIYFLLPGKEVSHLHRIKSDELWHYHLGSSLSIHRFDPDGKHKILHLGQDAERGDAFQAVVPAGCWFGAVVNDPDSFCLVGCTVAPGFDFEDFELGSREELLKLYPQHHEMIELLTRPS